MEKNPETVALSVTTVNKLLAYLQERPYRESSALINSIVQDINRQNDETKNDSE